MDYITHLQKDKKLARILIAPIEAPVVRRNIPLRLMASIMSQQLSTKVAKVIYHRFLLLYKGKEPSCKQVLATDPGVLRSIGLSNAKVQYVLNVATFFITEKLTDKKLASLNNDELITLLTQIKGVGRWTVEMLLMFSLGREDVFAVDDLGIQQAMIHLYKLDNTDKKALRLKMLRISDKWQPYRSYACRHLWQWKDTPAPTA
ncbi:DNA-3-methyladenine glycosylase family protein [Filimonas effusa]|uniref:DNA-3-methyladenine glycosylase II n=1 Tax=Filimonas effusa TaxID=2508721 RepID=A0A4Q1D510_9BACT|nr:DNA-3-methyladenine glycosylase [Filimonas effusa]RXK83560.1 DNA-3-methyladenine glycosylase 2 family protein [Filimonas effusa]